VPKLRLPDGSTFAQTGRVAFVENQVDPNTGTLPVYADFPNPQDILLPGMLVTAVVSPETPPIGFLLPAGAIGQDAQGKFVLVVGRDNKIERRTVEAKEQIEQSIAITKGLNDGERVVVEGGQKVRPGQVVRPIEEGARAQANEPAANNAPASNASSRSGTPAR
jgi:membrane fusion protein (multidrug efflux system)